MSDRYVENYHLDLVVYENKPSCQLAKTKCRLVMFFVRLALSNACILSSKINTVHSFCNDVDKD